MVKTAQQQRATPSLRRWWRNACYMPWLTQHRFDRLAQDQIEQAVANAEQGQPGEIRVVIEGNLPITLAYWHDTPQRTLQLFGELQVWDTAYNSGLLLYVNLCEHRVELLADRGIHAFVQANHWQRICDQISAELEAGHYVDGVLTGIEQIGKILQAFYQAQEQDIGNEISNRPILL